MLIGQALKNTVENHVQNYNPNNISVSSLDVTLGGTIKREMGILGLVDPCNPSHRPNTAEVSIRGEDKVILLPNQFVLGELVEHVSLPHNIAAMFNLRSLCAQKGLEQSSSLWIRPGWSGNLVVELKNNLQHNDIILKEGMVIGQLHFFGCKQ